MAPAFVLHRWLSRHTLKMAAMERDSCACHSSCSLCPVASSAAAPAWPPRQRHCHLHLQSR
eukprot:2003800-Pyramimonas_sp.AAC.1